MTRYTDAPVGDEQKILQAVYDLVLPLGKWPTFRKVDLYLDRHLGIADTQTALVTIPATYLRRPWQPHGFNDTDEVVLTLRGIAVCDAGLDDLDLLMRFLQWVTQVERSRDIDDAELILTSDEFAAHLGWRLEPIAEQSTAKDNAEAAEEEQSGAVGDKPVSAPATGASAHDSDAAVKTSEKPDRTDAEPPIDPQIVTARNSMVRLRLVTEQVRSISNAGGWNPERPWRWQYTIHRQRVRAFRDLASVEELLDMQEPLADEQERQRVEPALRAWPALPMSELDWTQPEDDGGGQTGDDAVSDATVASRSEAGLDVLLTVLRPEIADTCSKLLRGELFDEAIFAAYRYVEFVLQQRSGSKAIGDVLVNAAFVDAKNPIRVSDRGGDADRLVQLFQGPLGLFKGDRSHKDKPAIPCRSLRECIRQLAHASALLDLLDRDIAAAPRLLGYDHDQHKLTLWMERATPQTQVLLDERPRTVLSQTSVSITIDVADVPSGEHELVFVDGIRQSPGQPVWLTRDPGREVWYRVEQINIPLFTDASCTTLHAAAGVRLAVLESGVSSQQIVATTTSYRVGDYVSHAVGGATSIGPAWMRERDTEPAIQIFTGSALFSGDAEAPAHLPRAMRVSLQPDLVRLRVGEKMPVRALEHLTDGTATWTQPLDNPEIKSDDEKVAAFNGGVMFANHPGTVVIRLEHNGLYAEATVEVAAHPAGTLTDYVTALPPVVGLACTPSGLIISTREGRLLRVCRNGKLDIAAGLPLQPPTRGGTDTIAAAPGGDLAIRLYGHQDVLVLNAADQYASSRWVQHPNPGATITALGYDNDDLLVGLHNGDIWRISAGRQATQMGHVDGQPVSIATSDEGVLVLTGGSASMLWRMPANADELPVSLISDPANVGLSDVTYVKGHVYLAAFYAGQVLRLDGGTLVPVAVDLRNPNAITSDTNGTIYIGELGRGAVRRLFP